MKTETTVEYKTVEETTDNYVCERCDGVIGPVDETKPICVVVDPRSDIQARELKRSIYHELITDYSPYSSLENILSDRVTIKDVYDVVSRNVDEMDVSQFDGAHVEGICESCAEHSYSLTRDVDGSVVKQRDVEEEESGVYENNRNQWKSEMCIYTMSVISLIIGLTAAISGHGEIGIIGIGVWFGLLLTAFHVGGRS